MHGKLGGRVLTALKSRMTLRTLADDLLLRPRLRHRRWPEVVYAIGDVHGCLDQLRIVEKAIVADAQCYKGERLIVMLGDYVDRGPNSSGVLDHLLSTPPEGFDRICLAGNHEVLMADFLRQPRQLSAWLGMGGDVTLSSYGMLPNRMFNIGEARRRALIEGHVPRLHIDFLNGLPTALELPGVTFVHAGTRAGIDLDDQNEEDLLWMRPDPAEDARRGDAMIIHGHTPSAAPVLTRNRIGLDTAAFASGTLTAIRLARNGIRIIQS